jgi:hypothetical protein
MSIPSLMNGLRVIVVLTMVAGVLSFGSHSTLSHDSRATLADMEDGDDHGHDHDADGEQPFGHSPGHNPVDHSHVAMTATVMSATCMSAGEAGWHGGLPRTGRSEPLYPLDRPPRSGVRL